MYVFTFDLVKIGPAKSRPVTWNSFDAVMLSAGKTANSW